MFYFKWPRQALFALITLLATFQAAPANERPNCASPYKVGAITHAAYQCYFVVNASVPQHIYRSGDRAVKNYLIRRHNRSILKAIYGCNGYRVSGSAVVGGRSVLTNRGYIRASYRCARR